MENRFNTCVEVVFKWEGVYSNNPKDTGGATKYGITLETLSNWRGKKVAVKDVQALTLNEAREIYKAKYWTPINADNLPRGLDLIAFDAAVNHGVAFAMPSLQKVAGLSPTKPVDQSTIKALSLQPTEDLIEHFAMLRKERYVTRDNFATFGKGWFNRLDDVTNIALTGYTMEKWSAGNFLDYIAPDVDDFISNATLQKLLKEVDYYKGALDGLFGKQSIAAMSNFLTKEFGSEQVKWPLERRKILASQIFAKKAGIDVGKLDGFTGPQSKAAFEKLNYRLATGKDLPNWRDLFDKVTAPAIILPTTQWPLESDVPKFYGKVGENQTKVALPYKMKLAWDLKTEISSFQCHEKVAPSIQKIFQKTLDYYGEEQIKKLRLDLFAGCLNVRDKRGGSSPSMHSWGIAVDIDSANNQLKWNKTKASLARPEYEIFWRIVEGEGAVSLGRLKDYDWMHWQFARPN